MALSCPTWNSAFTLSRPLPFENLNSGSVLCFWAPADFRSMAHLCRNVARHRCYWRNSWLRLDNVYGKEVTDPARCCWLLLHMLPFASCQGTVFLRSVDFIHILFPRRMQINFSFALTEVCVIVLSMIAFHVWVQHDYSKNLNTRLFHCHCIDHSGFQKCVLWLEFNWQENSITGRAFANAHTYSFCFTCSVSISIVPSIELRNKVN